MTTEAERRDALRREVLRAQQEVERRRVEEIRAQPTPPAPTGGVSVSPELQGGGPAFRNHLANPFGLGDEIAGVIGAIDPNSSFRLGQDEARWMLARDREEHPVASTLGQMTGDLAVGGAIAGPLDDAIKYVLPGLRGASTLRRAGRGAIAGGVEGLAYGAGSGEGFDGRFTEALTYGALGATAGGALPIAGELGRRFVTNPIGGALGVGNQSRAANNIVRAMEEAGMGPDDIDRALRAAAADGQDMFNVADVLGHAGQRSLAGVARQPGAGRTVAQEALQSRQNNSTDRLAQYVTEAMDARNTRAQQTAAERVSRGVASDINYSQARANAQPVDVRGVISAIDDRIGPMRNTTIQGEGLDATLDGIRRRLSGVVREGDELLPAEMSDLNRLIRLYSEIGDEVGAATRGNRGFEASELRSIQRALGEALEEASSDWRAANAQHAAASRVVDAPDAGQAANTSGTRFADVADQWSDIETRINNIPGLTDEQRAQYIADARQAYRTGYANRDLANIESARRDTRNMADSLFNNDRQEANYRLMADDPDTFLRRVDREGTMSDTRYHALGGSLTQDNMADAAAANSEDISIIASLLSNRPAAAAGQVLGRAFNATKGLNEGTREAIARALLSNNPGELQRLLSTAQRNESVHRIVSGLIRGSTREPTSQALAR